MERSWSLEEEELLKKYNDIAKTHNLMHAKSFRFYSFIDSAISTSSIILSCVLGGSSLGSLLSTAVCDNIMAILIPFGVLSTGNAILSAISKKSKFGELANNHHKFASDYNKLVIKIEYQLSLKKDKRMEVYQFIQGIEERFEEIQEKAPTFPRYIEKQYMTDDIKKVHQNKVHSSPIKDTPLQLEFKKRMEDKYKCIKKDIVMEELRRSSKDIV